MIQRIRTSRTFRFSCVAVALNVFATLVAPMQSFALTGGPAQPEFNSFTPVGTSDMVDLSSGDMTYNIPLMDVGGYPLNMSYSAGVGMDQEASWVGLGWNLSVGQINRNVRGLPDDFKGDQLLYENHMKPNITVGASFQFEPGILGIESNGAIQQAASSNNSSNGSAPELTLGVSAMYNNYTGFTLKPSAGIQKDLGDNASVGFNVESGPDGLTIQPSLSLHKNIKDKKDRDNKLGASIGLSMNSRQGLTSATLSMSRKTQGVSVKNSKKLAEKTGSKSRSVTRNQSVGSSIGFTDQLYTPTKRVGMSTGSFTVNAALGGTIFGGEGEGEVTAYGTIMKVQDGEREKYVDAYGYAHTDEGNKHSVLDFNREKDGSFSVNSTNLPVTNYTYDIYSVQGQGVSGQYRPFRNQVGYVYDTYVKDGSFSGSLGFELGTGNVFKAGIDIEATQVSSHSGVWEDQNLLFANVQENTSGVPNYEKVHYKNVGDLSADQDYGMFTQTGAYQPIHVPITASPYQIGAPFFRKAKSEFRKKIGSHTTTTTTIGVNGPIKRTQRQNRNQAIYNLTVNDVNKGVGYSPLYTEPANYDLPSGAKGHHTAEVQIIRNDGARYVYGLPVYNLEKKEATFSVDESGNCSSGLVEYEPAKLGAPETLPHDQYFNRVTTPAYVHTHLLTSVLSTDYADVTGNGPTVDDLGSYTKFSYKKMNSDYKWRVPFAKNMANYNEGTRTNDRDDQGNYVYGRKELYYVDQIETKTHIAVFHYSERADAKGVMGEHGEMDEDQSMYKLDKIALYSIGEYDGLGINSASTPIKVVHFEYSYSLCLDVPNNDGSINSDNEISNLGGKLTLKKVFFTYRNSSMGRWTGYRFNYGEYAPVLNANNVWYNPDEYSPNSPSLTPNLLYDENAANPELTGLNPTYNIKGYDSWGNYKPNGTTDCKNRDPLSAPEFPFVEQDKAIQDNRAGVWSLRKINLPSGGDIKIKYESDDYGFVQDKEVMRMFKVVGAGEDSYPIGNPQDNDLSTNRVATELYGNPAVNRARQYLYVQVDDDAIAGNGDQYNQYLKGLLNGPPIYFRFLMNTTSVGGTNNGNDPAKFEYITGYFSRDETVTNGGEIFADGNGNKFLSIPVDLQEKEGGLINSIPNLTNDVHPISKATWHFGRKYLNDFVYSNQPNGNTNDIEQIVTDLLTPNIIGNLIEIFNGPNATLENKNIGRQFIAGKSWVRLNTLTGEKLGGGCRVSEIRMSDVWEEMTAGQGNYQTMNYGQKYSYTLENGKTSGVATYEPVGNKENPFVQPVYSTTNHLLAPDEENFVEMPFGESFFPSPQVTYGRVSVSNVTAGVNPNTSATVKQLHKTGKVVTEFYTSKDYPTIVDQTRLQVEEDKTPLLLNLLNLTVQKHATASQGYVIHLNDMNGKQKSQRVFAEGQAVAISGVDYIYDNHASSPTFSAGSDPDQNKGKLDNRVRVINPDGSIEVKQIGVETDVVHDFRENKTKTRIAGVNTNLNNFIFGVVPLAIPMPIPDVTINKDQFRSVSTTKVINTFGILKETIAYDAGAAVYTRNLAWDAATGEVLVTETIDEYNDKYFTFNYPAHWYYEGMAQASKNLGMSGTINWDAGLGAYTVAGINQANQYFIEGDELYIDELDQMATPIDPEKAWIKQISGNRIYLIDEAGNDITGQIGSGNNDYEVVRSGHRNLQSAGIMNVTLMHNPLTDLSGNYVSNLGASFLLSSNWEDWRIINAGAVDYSQDWEPPCECGFDNSVNGGIYNPYRVNEKGVWRTKSSRTYLTGRNRQADPTPRQQGFFTSFSPMYKLSQGGNWHKDFNDWTFVAEVTTYSPYGFELENKDALDRYSAAQYGYNNTFPMAVGANTRYQEIGFDGFEDYIGFDGCPNAHFTFKSVIDVQNDLTKETSHSGRHSLKVGGNSSTTMSTELDCTP